MNIEVFTMPGLKTHKEQSEFCIQKLKEMCEKKFDYTVDTEFIGKNEYGKPYFTNNDKIHFSISHSADRGVVMIDEHRCGVDIELLREVNYIKIAKRFFTDEESRYLLQTEKTDKEKMELFFKIWTGKEAYTKMLGCGLTMRMDSFSIFSKELMERETFDIRDNCMLCICREKTSTEE